MFCRICNNKYEENDKFCKYCGARLNQEQTQSPIQDQEQTQLPAQDQEQTQSLIQDQDQVQYQYIDQYISPFLDEDKETDSLLDSDIVTETAEFASPADALTENLDRNENQEIVSNSEVPAEMKCPECGIVYRDDKLFCVKCGSKLVSNVQGNICTACGEVLEKSDAFCGKCGKKVDKPDFEKICTACGAKSPSNAKYCCNCSKLFPYTSNASTTQAQTPKPIQTQARAILCPNCGSACSSFDIICPNCGKDISRATHIINNTQQNSVKKQPKHFSMAYHKFLIYFWLFASALYYFVMGIYQLTGGGNSSYAFKVYPELLGYCIGTGIIFIVLGCIALFTRRALSNYLTSAKKDLITFRCAEIFSLLFGPLYLYFFDFRDFDEITFFALLITFAVEVIWLACEIKYYDNRAELFEYSID